MTPFRVHFSDSELDDLRARLARVRWPDEAPIEAWSVGTSLDYMRGLVSYWRDSFDWRAQEARFNAFQQFTAPLAGIDVHFIHELGKCHRPLPLLLLHGWPGSVFEFHKIIPMLTDPERFGADPADAFTVIAPSLPGYGFSFRAGQPRFGIEQMAELSMQLMTDVLGYERFGAQAGDLGAFVAARLAATYPQRLAGIHLNMLPLRRDPKSPASPTQEEAEYLKTMDRWLKEETGYQWIQGTKPQTLAFGLADSPVGLAAWIIEKFRSWSDCNGNP